MKVELYNQYVRSQMNRRSVLKGAASVGALAAMGEGEVTFKGQITKTEVAFQTTGITPVELSSKEGLALINGTDGMLGQLVLAIFDITNLLKTLDITTSLSV